MAAIYFLRNSAFEGTPFIKLERYGSLVKITKEIIMMKSKYSSCQFNVTLYFQKIDGDDQHSTIFFQSNFWYAPDAGNGRTFHPWMEHVINVHRRMEGRRFRHRVCAGLICNFEIFEIILLKRNEKKKTRKKKKKKKKERKKKMEWV